MQTYYCERKDRENPVFRDYKTQQSSHEEALEFFKKRHGDQLELVYVENDDGEMTILYDVGFPPLM